MLYRRLFTVKDLSLKLHNVIFLLLQTSIITPWLTKPQGKVNDLIERVRKSCICVIEKNLYTYFHFAVNVLDCETPKHLKTTKKIFDNTDGTRNLYDFFGLI